MLKLVQLIIWSYGYNSQTLWNVWRRVLNPVNVTVYHSNHDTSWNSDLISNTKSYIRVFGWHFIWNGKCHNGNFVYWLSTHTHIVNSIRVSEVSFRTKLWSVSFVLVFGQFFDYYSVLLSSIPLKYLKSFLFIIKREIGSTFHHIIRSFQTVKTNSVLLYTCISMCVLK